MQNKVETRDKYKAVWVSHSSMGDWLKCPRLYYLHNVYKNSEGRKVAIVSPYMSLGVAVHNVLENLANFKSDERMSRDLLADYENEWVKVSGEIGGFTSPEQEAEFKERGRGMIERVIRNPNFLEKKTIKFPPVVAGEKVDMLPHYYLNDVDNIILCGKVDWIEYLPESDSLRVIDFKTGKNDEKEGSLQLPIYQLLLNNLQKRKVVGAQYWYVDRDDAPVDATLGTLEDAYEKVYPVAKQMLEARTKSIFECKNGGEGCMHCRPYEAVISGEAKYVGKGEYKQDLYILN